MDFSFLNNKYTPYKSTIKESVLWIPFWAQKKERTGTLLSLQVILKNDYGDEGGRKLLVT